MKNLNLRVSDEVYWRFQEVKAKLKAETNEDVLTKMIEKIEELLSSEPSETSRLNEAS